MTPLTSQVTPLQSPRGGAPVGAPDPAPGVGRNANAVGQQAKLAVAEARAAGVALPSNAQGIAASGIARGVDPASLFASQVAEPPVSEPSSDAPEARADAPDAGPPAEADAGDGTPTTATDDAARLAAQTAAEGYGDVADAVAVAPVDPNEIAAQLLADVTA